MTKEDFLKKLEQQLHLINDEERADILSEYEQHIEMKINNGLSEEEAIEDFGLRVPEDISIIGLPYQYGVQKPQPPFYKNFGVLYSQRC